MDDAVHPGVVGSGARRSRRFGRRTPVALEDFSLENAVEPADHAEHTEKEGLRQDQDIIRKVRRIIGVTPSLRLRYSASSAGNCRFQVQRFLRCDDETG